jgi:hypothetical protein
MGPTRRSCASLYSRPRDTSETDTETSERRPRGRPRRSSRDDNVSLPTVGEEAVAQMYDDVVPPTSEEAVPPTSAEGAGGSTSSAASKPYLRGPAKLPRRPIPTDRRPLIAPEGDK